ncbi:factor of DNA methylation 1-like isoform X1 [Triticum urartu]|uniref:Factor of DNA methylation 1-5/IDN2 domain-containing protein n=1 Tax=Triticum urartu TaxID=4572 RepID=A0A8R7PV48_TRIUA|nr:factor of DNA methylation 1-like isoform X1 [Triticum urartu]XP_048564636.1 factor of DNA methylation 1-like isoform X1 [Triticum urartu]
MAETGDASSDWLARLSGLGSYVCSKMNYHEYCSHEYNGIHSALHRVLEEKEKVEQEHKARLQLVAAKEELVKRNEEQEAEIQSLKRKLQASEARHTPAQGSGREHNQSGRKQVQRTSVQKRKRQSEGQAGEDAEDHQAAEILCAMNNLEQGLSAELRDVREETSNINAELIKGFLDMGGVGRQNIAVKYMGQLSERPFLLACLQKFLRKEAEAEASRLCKFWQEQLMNPEWYPFKTDTVGGISEGTINDDDIKLQELRATWGEESYKALVKALVNSFLELKECGKLSDRTIVAQLWNFEEDRKATLSESVEYVCNKVKSLSNENVRTSTRGKRGRCVGRA